MYAESGEVPGVDPPGTVLVVADPAVLDALLRQLDRRQFDLVSVSSVRAARSVVPADPSTALILLDCVLADGDAPALADLVEQHDGPPVVMFSSQAETVADRVRWLDVGADDFVPWPASPAELVARIRSVLRRRGPEPRLAPLQTLSAGELVVDMLGLRVSVGAQPVRLTSLEFQLLAYLMCHPGEAVTREALLCDVWGYHTGPTATVTVHVRRLREKLEPDPLHPIYIRTIWGVGYRFEADVVEGRSERARR